MLNLGGRQMIAAHQIESGFDSRLSMNKRAVFRENGSFDDLKLI
jgi:hypothetical protein